MLSPVRFHLSALLLMTCCALVAVSQDIPTGWVLTRPNREVRVALLPPAASASKDPTDILEASVEMAVMDPAVCCGRKSALEDEAALTEPTSVKQLGEKLRGKHHLDSGEAATVVDQYWPGSSVSAENIVGCLSQQHPLLMEWNEHVYVVYGAVFDEYAYSSGAVMDVIKKLLLLDLRYSGKRRYVSFDRQADDWSKVTGLLALSITH
ncbi:MAG TPA: hypothetical protein VEI49_06285 [Terriglobales bacterium]|nr:hypothetical protein [Terriglobales bacterium]